LAVHGADSASARFAVARIKTESRDLAGALAQYEAGLALDPKNRDARRNFGLLLAQNSELDRATQVLKELLAEFPDDAPAHLNFGLVKAATGKFDEAMHALETAIGLDSKLKGAYFALAQIHIESGAHRQALSVFERGLKAIGPADDLAAAYRSAAKIAGDPGRAERFLTELNAGKN
jgi:Tfp pilus assembly protein PilF